MIVVVDNALWTSGHELALLALIACCADERHILVTLPSWHANHHLQRWLSQQPRTLQVQISAIFRQSAAAMPLVNSALAATIVVVPSAGVRNNRVAIDMALRLLQRPLKALLENSRNDFAFLRHALPVPVREMLDRARALGRIEPEMGGGITEIKKRLETLCSLTDDQSFVERARLWVLVDRDAHPDDRSLPSESSQAVLQSANGAQTPWRIHVHQLQRRAIENYAPAAILHLWASLAAGLEATKRRKRVEALLKLRRERPNAAAQFNMKRGLSGDVQDYRARVDVASGRRHIQESELDPLFQNLSDQDRTALTHGFAGLAELFADDYGFEESYAAEISQQEALALANSILERI